MMRRAWKASATVVGWTVLSTVSLALSISLANSSGGTSRQARLAEDLLVRIAAEPNRPLDVVVRYRPGQERAAVAAIPRRVIRRLSLDHSVVTRLTGTEVRRLLASPTIESIEADFVCRATRDTSQASFGITKARADFRLNGDGDGDPATYSARDHTICVIDTGIDGGHADFSGGKIIAWQDFVQGRAQPYDDDGHGTHVASIAAGAVQNGIGGVAPAAALIGLKVLDADGNGSASVIASAVSWCILNKQRYGIDVINLSLGGGASSAGTDLLSRMVDLAAAAGIVVCVAAGNDGPGRYTIASPGAAAEAITVGYMADAGKGGYYLHPHSSRGPTADGRGKPDLCAPGYQIGAARFATPNGSVRLTGSSMATPFVSGVVALMRQANPSLAPSRIKALLKETAVPFGRDRESCDFGAGRLDGFAALAAAGQRFGSAPAVADHRFASHRLRGSGDIQTRTIAIDETRYPLAVSLIMEEEGTDFDLEIVDPDGKSVGRSETDERQELLTHQPTRTGTFTILIRSFQGSGDCSLDISAGISLPEPAAPCGLSARPMSPSQINLAWADGSTNESGFVIYRKTGANPFAQIAVVGRNVSTFADRLLGPSTAYTYRLKAVNDKGASSLTNEASALTMPSAPMAPGDLQARVISQTQIDLSWADRSDNEAVFCIVRRSADEEILIATVPAGALRFTDTGVEPNTRYTYWVFALNETGPSGPSNEASGTTLPPPPASPAGLAAKVISATQIQLTWVDRSTDETGFIVYRKTGAGAFIQIATLGANATAYNDRSLAPTTTYCYRVRAVNGGVMSARSKEVTARTLAPL